jgi:glycosyltransferase involved in cell wall biosynthesis
MSNIDLTVLIPVFNRQEKLEKTINSLGKQGVPFDIIIVDDGSSDAIKEIPHPGKGEVVVLRHQKNKGIVGALNTGLDYIRSKQYKFVARIDAGDICNKNRLKLQRDFLLDNNDYALVGGQVQYFDMEGNKFPAIHLPTDNDDICKKIHLRTCFFHPAVMYTVDAVNKIGGYSAEYPHAEDYEFFFRLSRHWKVANLNEVVLMYEYSDDSITQKHRFRQSISILKVLVVNFDWKKKQSYIGVIYKLISLGIPKSLMRIIKSKIANTDRMIA